MINFSKKNEILSKLILDVQKTELTIELDNMFFQFFDGGINKYENLVLHDIYKDVGLQRYKETLDPVLAECTANGFHISDFISQTDRLSLLKTASFALEVLSLKLKSLFSGSGDLFILILSYNIEGEKENLNDCKITFYKHRKEFHDWLIDDLEEYETEAVGILELYT